MFLTDEYRGICTVTARYCGCPACAAARAGPQSRTCGRSFGRGRHFGPYVSRPAYLSGRPVEPQRGLVALRGLAAQFFSPAAKLLARSPLVPRLFAWRAADRSAVERLIDGTGSTLDVTGVELYGRVVSNPAHAAAALGMTNWDLVPLARDLPRLNPRLMLVTGDNDRTLSPSEALRVRALLPSAERVSLRVWATWRTKNARKKSRRSSSGWPARRT